MEQNNETTQLKAEIYDLSKALNHATALLNVACQITQTNTPDTLLAALREKFQPNEKPAE